jgi:hypothetical protein
MNRIEGSFLISENPFCLFFHTSAKRLERQMLHQKIDKMSSQRLSLTTDTSGKSGTQRNNTALPRKLLGDSAARHSYGLSKTQAQGLILI